MKKTPFYLLTLFVALVFAANFSAIAFAQAPPEITDPFSTTTTTTTTTTTEEEAPPTLELPAAEEPELPAADEPEEEPAPEEEAAPAPTHSAAPAPKPASYSGAKVADSGPGLAIIGLGSLIGAAAIRRRKK